MSAGNIHFYTSPEVKPDGWIQITSNHRVLDTDKKIFIDNTDAENPLVVTLPSAVNFQELEFVCKDAGGAVIIVPSVRSQTVSGLAAQIMSTNSALKLISDGIDTWYILESLQLLQ